MTRAQFAFYLLLVSGPVSLLEVDVCSVPVRRWSVCNPIKNGRWSELMVVCVCHSDEVMREADANDTSGELGSALPGSLVGESVFRTAKLEILTESASCLSNRLFRSARVNGEHWSLLGLVDLCLSASGRLVVNNAHCKNWPGGCTRYIYIYIHVIENKSCLFNFNQH